MIQPIKQFRVTRLTISGFKGYADQKTFQFGGMNVISGHMGVGKSSIADAIAFAITGVGFYAGAKIDYLYHQDTRDLLVELEFEDESGKLRTLARHRKDDKMDITLDGVRIGQGDLTTMFGERDLFLSMFNPQYFINVLGSKGRNLLERYLPEVPKAEVLAQLSDQTRALLEKQEFLSAEAYSKQLREQVTDIEKDMLKDLSRSTPLEQFLRGEAISTVTFQTIFKQIYGRSPYAYLKHYRMNSAAVQLRESNESINQIALSLGYSNASKFARAFRDVFGVLPKDYRTAQKAI